MTSFVAAQETRSWKVHRRGERREDSISYFFSAFVSAAAGKEDWEELIKVLVKYHQGKVIGLANQDLMWENMFFASPKKE